uniref:SFRICE_002024 n=1 Tax=Spodoptera frugiperda TaxID=7108 RepID=A0A2H1WIW7_SPOFR
MIDDGVRLKSLSWCIVVTQYINLKIKHNSHASIFMKPSTSLHYRLQINQSEICIPLLASVVLGAGGSGYLVPCPPPHFKRYAMQTTSQVARCCGEIVCLHELTTYTNVSLIYPPENAVAATKPKRRAYLLKRKALTTGFFDQSRTKDADKDKVTISLLRLRAVAVSAYAARDEGSLCETKSTGGSVFGVPLSQCVESERALRRQQHGGSRASLASLGALEKGDDGPDRQLSRRINVGGCYDNQDLEMSQ